MFGIKLQKLEDIDAQIQVEHQAWLQEKGIPEARNAWLKAQGKDTKTKGTPDFGFLGFTESLYNKTWKPFPEKTLDETEIESEKNRISAYRMYACGYMEDRLSFSHKIGHYYNTVIEHGFNLEKIKEELRNEAEARIKIAEELEEYEKFYKILRERFLLQAIQETFQKTAEQIEKNFSGLLEKNTDFAKGYTKLKEFFETDLSPIHLQTKTDYLEKYRDVTEQVGDLIKQIESLENPISNSPDANSAKRESLNSDSVNTSESDSGSGKFKLQQLKPTTEENSPRENLEQLRATEENSPKENLLQLEVLTKRWINLKLAKVKKTTAAENTLDGIWGISNSIGIDLGLISLILAIVAASGVSHGVAVLLLPWVWGFGNASLENYLCNIIESCKMVFNIRQYHHAPTWKEIIILAKDVVLFPFNAFGNFIFPAASGTNAKHLGKLIYNCAGFVWNNVASNFIGVEDRVDSFETSRDFALSKTTDFKLKNTPSATSFKNICSALLNNKVTAKNNINTSAVEGNPTAAAITTVKKLKEDLKSTWQNEQAINSSRNFAYVHMKANSTDLISKKSHHGQILNWDAGFFCLGGKSAHAKLVYNAVAEYEALKPNEKKITRLRALSKIGQYCEFYLKANFGDASKRRYSYVENLKLNVDNEIQNLKSHYTEKDSTLNLVGYKSKQTNYHNRIVNWDYFFFSTGTTTEAKKVDDAVKKYKDLKSYATYKERYDVLIGIQNSCGDYLKERTNSRRYSYVEDLNKNVQKELQNLMRFVEGDNLPTEMLPEHATLKL